MIYKASCHLLSLPVLTILTACQGTSPGSQLADSESSSVELVEQSSTCGGSGVLAGSVIDHDYDDTVAVGSEAAACHRTFTVEVPVGTKITPRVKALTGEVTFGGETSRYSYSLRLDNQIAGYGFKTFTGNSGTSSWLVKPTQDGLADSGCGGTVEIAFDIAVSVDGQVTPQNVTSLALQDVSLDLVPTTCD